MNDMTNAAELEQFFDETDETPIEGLMSHVESITKEPAYQQISRMADDKSENDFYLGGLLLRCKEKKWYLEDGYDNFRQFVEDKFCLRNRKALYLIAHYKKLTALGIPWEKVEHIGWTKLSVILVIVTADTIDEWISKAEENTVMQLKALVAETITARAEKSDGERELEEAPNPMKYMSIKIFEDQEDTIRGALDKAKVEGETEYDGQALEAICLNYLTGDSNVTVSASEWKPKPSQLEAFLKEHMCPEDAFSIFCDAYPHVTASISLKPNV